MGTLAAVLVVAAGAQAAAGAPMTVVYERESAAGTILGHPALAGRDWLVQQGPAAVIAGVPGQAGKVTTYAPTPLTPRILGRTPAQMAAMLRAEIAASGVHLVFIDELSADFRGADGSALAAALRLLEVEPSPVPGVSMARRVHVYVPSPGWMLQDPGGWTAALDAMRMSGGVWLEGFRAHRGRPTPWTDHEWATWPAAFLEMFERAGGDPARAHLLISAPGVARAYRWARRGAACEMLANGPGAYITESEADVFARLLAADIGPDGSLRPRCGPAARLSAGRARAAAGVLALSAGARLGARVLRAPSLTEGRRSGLRIAFGPDPLRIAHRLRVPPERFWKAARPRLRLTGAGVQTVVAVTPGAPRTVRVHPRVPGPVLAELLIDGDAIRRQLGPADLPGSTSPWRGRLTAITPALLATPARWNLAVPLIRTRIGTLRSSLVVQPAAGPGRAPPSTP